MADDQKVPSDYPSTEEFFTSVPLYDPYPIVPIPQLGDSAYALEYFEGTIDFYCEGCGRHSVFQCRKKDYQNVDHSRYYTFAHWFMCSRNRDHKIMFVFMQHEKQIQKIGQYPSLADLAAPGLQKYRNALGNGQYRELTRGVGLAAHGVGIGAFVYLRRIFSSLIEKAHIPAKDDAGWNEELYEKGRMEEKILLLKAHLPPFLVENRKLYGILSKGIHDLAEAECLEAFPVVKLGIELILDEELERIAKEEKVQAARKEIVSLGERLKRPPI